MSRKAVGQIGEQRAVDYLIRQGFRIVDRNVRIGRGEIDIIATDGETWVFVEVKAGRKSSYGEPEERVNLQKQRQLGKLAQQYIQEHELGDVACRFDVVIVRKVGPGWRIRHFEDAFWLERE
jgi:putative endonuclease